MAVAKDRVFHKNRNDSFNAAKYLGLFSRERWKIFLISVSLFLMIVPLVFKLAPHPNYTVSAVLRFSENKNVATIKEDSGDRYGYDAKISLLLSRNFLEQVVDKLDLFLVINDYYRSDVVDTLTIDDSYKTGEYTIKKSGDVFQLYYSNEQENISNEKLFQTKLTPDYWFNYKFLHLKLKPAFFEEQDDVKFYLTKKISRVEWLKKNINANFIDRGRTVLRIDLTGTDPFLITNTLNILVEEFRIQNLNYTKVYTRQILSILNEQLTFTKNDLEKAEEELKTFRQNFPWVGLTLNMSNIVTDISTSEGQKLNLTKKSGEIERIVNRYNTAGVDEKSLVLGELIAFLGGESVSTVSALQNEYNSVITERNRLVQSYSKNHPLMLENEKKIEQLGIKVVETANHHRSTLEQRLRETNRDLTENNFKIRSLPGREAQLAELQRKRNVAEEIYADVLVRYNQAKLADVVEVGDVFILDNAILPELISQRIMYIKYILMGLIGSLAAAFGFVLLNGYFDKSVHVSNEIEEKLNLKVLASIPVIGDGKEIPEEISLETNSRIEPRLITVDYSPTPVGEAYRSLRTQLLFLKEKKPLSTILVTSLNPSDGKSLNASNLAITFAQQKLPTLLFDADLRRGVLHNSFACSKSPGFSDFLYSNAEINHENMKKFIQSTHIPNLFLISSGMNIPNPSELLGTYKLEQFLNLLKNKFSVIIIDTPPINVTADAVILSKQVDSVLLVVRAGRTNVAKLGEKLKEYDQILDKIEGTVFNFSEEPSLRETYQYSYYKY
ncbi:MAG: polysaccharide biosynthesis tyrosine autokinase [Calditrichaceae bacterium]